MRPDIIRVIFDVYLIAKNNADFVQLLPGFSGESGPVNAVYLEGRTLPRKIRALIDFAVTDIRASGIL